MAERERWRGVPDWPGYKVSSRSRAKSVPRTLANGREHGGGPLTPTPDKDGYLYVTLRDGKRSRRVHLAVLVLETFVGPCPPGHEALHGDLGHQVNDLVNLRWGTHLENERDKRRTEVRNRREVSRPSTSISGCFAEVQR